ncbi:MAG: energy-coupling factor ABC transporter ATP-binding protein [Butyrivibrio sp.]|nr:energy-coupling factor ABC transporter ATP-binding protein [Butyrivibrio sp.]
MILECENISFRYDADRAALAECTFSAEEGARLGLIGCNGAGKSTLLKLITGLLKPCGGSIEVGGLKVCKANIAEIRKKAGFVFQEAENQLFMPTVAEDVAFGPFNYGIRDGELEQTVTAALASLGIEELRDRRITRLSGGEKKLVSLATVLALKPELLILDEPTIALDPGNRRRLIDILNGLSQTLLIASHDLDMIWDTCTDVILMTGGRIAASGSAREILTDRELLEANGLELPLRFSGG